MKKKEQQQQQEQRQKQQFQLQLLQQIQQQQQQQQQQPPISQEPSSPMSVSSCSSSLSIPTSFSSFTDYSPSNDLKMPELVQNSQFIQSSGELSLSDPNIPSQAVRDDSSMTMNSNMNSLNQEQNDMLSISFRMDGNIIQAKNVFNILGYKPGELIGKDFFQAIHVTDVDIAKKVIEVVSKFDDTRFLLLFRMKKKDFGYLWIEGKGVLYKDEETHQPTYIEITGPVHNIYSNQQQEIQNESLEYGSFTIKSSPDGRCIDTTDGIKYSLGYSRDEMYGKWILDLAHPSDLAIMHHAQSKLIERDGSECSLRMRFKCKEGNYMWMETNARTIRSPLTRIVEYLICTFKPLNFLESLSITQAQATCVKSTEPPYVNDKGLVENLLLENHSLREENKKLIALQIENENLRNHIRAIQGKLEQRGYIGSGQEMSIDEIPLEWLHTTINQQVM